MPDRVPTSDSPGRLALIGTGRAGGAVAGALVATGWRVTGVAGRNPEAPSVRAAADRFDAVVGRAIDVVPDVDLVLIATPDGVIDAVAAAVAPRIGPSTLVVHLSGARGLDALAAIRGRTGALHPLQSLPDPVIGTARLAGSYAAVAGDPHVEELARTMGMVPIHVPDEARVVYDAAACVASNHLVALLAQVDACTGVPLEAFLPLVRSTVDNVAELGTRAALTGPVARGDVETVRAHLASIPVEEQEAYRALARRAAVLAGRSDDLAAVLA